MITVTTSVQFSDVQERNKIFFFQINPYRHMKATLNKLIKILLFGDVWIENCQIKPISNFEEEIWVERLFVDAKKLTVKVQYREVDQTDAPRFTDDIVNLFKPNQIKFLLELAQKQPEFSVDIKGSGTKGDIIHALERLLENVKSSDIADYEVETACLYTIIETKENEN